MTLETARKRLEIEKARGNEEAVKMWEERIQRKLRHPKYAHLKEEAQEDTQTKSKGKK